MSADLWPAQRSRWLLHHRQFPAEAGTGLQHALEVQYMSESALAKQDEAVFSVFDTKLAINDSIDSTCLS